MGTLETPIGMCPWWAPIGRWDSPLVGAVDRLLVATSILFATRSQNRGSNVRASRTRWRPVAASILLATRSQNRGSNVRATEHLRGRWRPRFCSPRALKIEDQQSSFKSFFVFGFFDCRPARRQSKKPKTKNENLEQFEADGCLDFVRHPLSKSRINNPLIVFCFWFF